MLNRITRSNKDQELPFVGNQDPVRLERAIRKAKKTAEMVNPIVLIRGDDGMLHDEDGNRRNAAGQRLADDGSVILEQAVDPAAGAGNAAVRFAQRTLGDYNRPDQFYANRAAIRPPAFQRNDFELKPAYYTLVAQHPFHGLSHEHPMDHIEKFEDLVTSIKANGVSNDFLFCKLFPYSLGGDAAYWLKQLEPGSLTTWEETKNTFLNNFYDDARSEELRTKISSFSQGPTEAFKTAWLRFKSYQRDCPHHGFNQVQLLGIFFRGVDWRYQIALDAASNGNFNTRFPADATVLIENLASSNSTKNADFERQKMAGNMGGSQIAAVKAKLDSVHNLLVGRKSVQFAAEVENFEPVEEENVNFINGAGFRSHQGYGSPSQKPFQSNNFQRSYGSSSYQKPHAQDSEVKTMLEQILEGQTKMTVDFNGKMDAMYRDLDGKIENLNIHVKNLDTQVAQTATAVKRQDGFLPGQPDTNPRRHVNAVMVRVEEEFVQAASFVDDRDPAMMVSIDTGRECRSTPPHLSLLEEGSIDTTVLTPEVGVDRHPLGVDRHPSQRKPESDPTSETVEKEVYKPKIPFPRASRRSKQELEDAKCKAMMDKLMVEMSLADAVYLSPVLRRYVKRMVVNGVSPEEGALLTRDISAILTGKAPEKKKKERTSEQVSVVTQGKIPEKLDDPGSFVLDCSISTGRFPHSLVDLGSGINLMPSSVAARLGMTELQPSGISLILADRSKRIPEGVLKDVPVKVEGCTIPTDFVVLEYEDEPQDPLILGRPFLATAGAVIDVKKGKIELDLGDDVKYFDMDKSRRRSTITGHTFSVGTSTDDQLSTEPADDITAECVEKLNVNEQVNTLVVQETASENAAVFEDWSGDHIFETRVRNEVLRNDKLLEEDVFVMETRIVELEWRKRVESRATELVSIDTISSVDRHPSRRNKNSHTTPCSDASTSIPPLPTAYTPPQMRRGLQRRTVALSDPP